MWVRYVKLSLCYFYRILNRYLSVVSSYVIRVVYVPLFPYVYVCYISLCLLPLVIVAIIN
jgi:hypothetical protein